MFRLEFLDRAIHHTKSTSANRFNYPAKKLHKRLIQLGATPLCSRGDGDDQHYLGVDGALDPWLFNWWESVLKLFPIPLGQSIIPDNVLPDSIFSIRILDETKITEKAPLKGDHKGKIVSNKRLTKMEHFQDTRLIEIDAPGVEYNCGDSAIIYPQNTKARVDKALNDLDFQINPDAPIQFTPRNNEPLPLYLENPISLRALFQYHLDLFGRPKRYFFHLLSFFATDEQHKEKLAELASSEGLDQLYQYCYRPKRNIYEVLKDFPSIKIPIRYILDLIPVMKPRYFSISSALSESTSTVALTVAIVQYKTILSEIRKGVCTDYLSQLDVGNEIGISIAQGLFRIPSHHVPIICISPGTGIAPMRSILRDRFQSPNPAESILFFGCRSKDADYYYEQEWLQATENCNFQIIPAFSRDQEDKVYVQHKLLEHAPKVWEMITNGALIFLSGFLLVIRNAKKMPDDVRNALVTIISQKGGMELKDAEKYFEKMEAQGRYQEECWS